MKRSTTPKIRKRKHPTEDSDTDEVPPKQRAAIQDTYGCIKWDGKFLPFGETRQKKREKMKMMSQQTDTDLVEVGRLMKATFYTQCKQVKPGGKS